MDQPPVIAQTEATQAVSLHTRRRREANTCSGYFLDAMGVWLAGMRDAVTLHQCLFFFANSSVILYRTLQCFILNGVIFLGSIVLFNLAIEPAMSALRKLVDEDDAWVADVLGISFSFLYKVLWIYPIYCISFVLNTVMYQEVADSAFVLIKKRPLPAASLLTRLVDEAYRMLLNLVYIIEINLLFYIPFIGPPLYFLHSCWLASMYCFEYRWVHYRWSSNARLDYFEKHWLYFAGFGFPASVVSFLCPRFIDTGIFALFFPLCILTAATAEPQAIQSGPVRLRQLPIFKMVQCVSCFALRICERRLGSGNAQKKGR